jgi:hypothetical protein
MKRILIIGDSWAIIPCNIYTPQSLWHKHHLHHGKQYAVLDWLDFKLLEKGHSVSNRSYGGNANWFQLGIAETFIDSSVKNKFHIDLIIWFHTELLRDANIDPNLPNNKYLNIVKEQGLEGLIDNVAIETYNYATQIHNISPSTKWAIIGGHAPVCAKHQHLLSWADMMVSDWRSDILGISIPECHTLSYREKDWDILRNNSNLDLDVVLDELNKKQFIMEACKNKDLFYDEVHPSPKSNILLAERIINTFNL